MDFATSVRVIERNTTDPFLQTATLSSRVHFNKQFDWGAFSMGGSLTQDLSNGGATQTLPAITLTHSPIDIAENVTWSPNLSITNSVTRNQRPGVALLRPPAVE